MSTSQYNFGLYITLSILIIILIVLYTINSNWYKDRKRSKEIKKFQRKDK